MACDRLVCITGKMSDVATQCLLLDDVSRQRVCARYACGHRCYKYFSTMRLRDCLPQQVMANVSGALSVVYIIHSLFCTHGDADGDMFFARLLSSTLFIMGVASFLQVTLGVR